MNEPRIPRPARDVRIQPYIDNGLIVSSVFKGAGYAGDAANPRPMTPVDLAEMAQIENQDAAPLRREIPDSAVFPIWSARVRSALDKGLAVPPEHLWWFVQPGDTVLLSDRVTHHFTTAGQVDREGGTISFVDPWPENFFLQDGRNTLEIEAAGTRISQAQFTRCAVGIATWDRLSLFEAYLEAYPAQAASAEVQYRIGHAILGIGPDRLAPMAATRFSMAQHLAQKAGNSELALASAARLYLSAVCGHAVMTSAGVQDVAAAMAGLLRDVHANRSPEELVAPLRPQELTRMAFCISHVGRHDMAEAASTRAIELDPAFEDGYWLRGTARFKQGRPVEALADVEIFLEINERAMAGLRLQRSTIHPNNNIAINQTETALAERVRTRTAVLELAVSAAAYAKDLRLAAKYLHLLQALHPTRADVAPRLEAIEAALRQAGTAGPDGSV
jgi:tetratricopeptide (TPR) repeat protein